jgi:TFIIF-interacting CTD phosphatase-like protein
VANYQQIYDPNMRGVLFKNDQKGNPKAPLYRGSCVINNVDMNISAWIQTSKKSGDKFMSLKFESKGEGRLSRTEEPQRTPDKSPPQQQLTEDNWDDDSIPF